MARINAPEGEAYKIEFPEYTDAWLAYGINASALDIHVYADTLVSIRVYNSRDKLTPGYIHIPLEVIPEVIADLQNLYINNAHKTVK